jgi:hypothetical protein
MTTILGEATCHCASSVGVALPSTVLEVELEVVFRQAGFGQVRALFQIVLELVRKFGA